MTSYLLNKWEWVSEWQKKLPLHLWLNLQKREDDSYPSILWVAIEHEGSQKETYRIDFQGNCGRPEKIIWDQSKEMPDNVKSDLLEAFKKTLAEHPRYSATPSKKIEVAEYGFSEGESRVFRYRKCSFEEYNCYDARQHLSAKWEDNFVLEYPDGRQEKSDEYGDIYELKYFALNAG